MTNAKLILAAVAVLAVAGGVYAGKARTGDVVFTKSTPTATICDVPLPLVTFTSTKGALITTSTYATFPAGQPCTLTTIYHGE